MLRSEGQHNSHLGVVVFVTGSWLNQKFSNNMNSLTFPMVPLSGSRSWLASHEDWSCRGATLTLKSCIQLSVMRKGWPSQLSHLPDCDINEYINYHYMSYRRPGCRGTVSYGHFDIWRGFRRWWCGDHHSHDLHSFMKLDTGVDLATELLLNHHNAGFSGQNHDCGTGHGNHDDDSETNLALPVATTSDSPGVGGKVTWPMLLEALVAKQNACEVTDLQREPVKVTQHRRIRKNCQMVYAHTVLDEVRCKFGVPKRTEANLMAVRRFANGIMVKHGVRPSHCAKLLPYVVHSAFIPTDDDIRAVQWLGSGAAKERLRLYHGSSTTMQY